MLVFGDHSLMLVVGDCFVLLAVGSRLAKGCWWLAVSAQDWWLIATSWCSWLLAATRVCSCNVNPLYTKDEYTRHDSASENNGRRVQSSQLMASTKARILVPHRQLSAYDPNSGYYSDTAADVYGLVGLQQMRTSYNWNLNWTYQPVTSFGRATPPTLVLQAQNMNMHEVYYT